MADDIVRLVPRTSLCDADWLRSAAKQLADEYGDRISGAFILVRLGSEGKIRPATARASLWPCTAELIGHLHLRMRQLDDEVIEEAVGFLPEDDQG